jgi:Succinylglutamate desuccinylase / Aspartoacylase family
VTPEGARTVEPPDYPVELEWVDLAPYRRGNTGIDHVHSFDSGVPGPHVMVNALTHGNELCGMHVVRRLLDIGLRPRAGRLTLSFANVAAYDRFGPQALQSRFVDRDLNRLWNDDLLAQDHVSVEARRAHVLAPLVRSVQRLLDLHSTWHALVPFFVLARLPRVRRFADRVALPPRQLLLPAFRHEGYHLIDYGAFAAPDGDAIGLIAECGQHFAAASVATAWQVTLRFLQRCGSIGDDTAAELGLEPVAAQAIERFEIVQPVIAATDHLRMACAYAGFVRLQAGGIAAYDGAAPVTAPFDGAIVLAPRPDPRAGQQAFAWGRLVTD